MDTAGSQHIIKFRAEFRITVMEKVPMVAEAAERFVDGITGHLNHPRLGRMPGHTSESHPTAFQIQEEEDVISYQAAPCQDLDGKKIRSR